MFNRLCVVPVVICYVFLSFLSCGSDNESAGPKKSIWKKSSSKIAFETTRGGAYDIYTMNADGSDFTRISDGRGRNRFPSWSPDGSQLVYMSNRRVQHTYDLLVINSDGTGMTKITDFRGWNGHPDWSPDGKKIVFDTVHKGNFEIFSINADGSDPKNLSNHPEWENRPCWSPDGSKVAFVTNRDGNFEIYVMNADGSNQTNLTQHSRRDDMPCWSPDGTKIAFVSNRDHQPEKEDAWVERFHKKFEETHNVIKTDNAKLDVFVMNADGSDQINLTNFPDNDTKPTWSPDGSRIAFVSFRDGKRDIFTIAPDGSDLQRIIDDEHMDEAPDWSGTIK